MSNVLCTVQFPSSCEQLLIECYQQIKLLAQPCYCPNFTRRKMGLDPFCHDNPLWPMALWHLQCIKLRCLPSSWGVHLTCQKQRLSLQVEVIQQDPKKAIADHKKVPVTWISEGLVMISFCIKLYPSNHNRSRYTTLSLNQPVHHVVQPAPIRKPSASLSWSFRWEILVVLPPNLV